MKTNVENGGSAHSSTHSTSDNHAAAATLDNSMLNASEPTSDVPLGDDAEEVVRIPPKSLFTDYVRDHGALLLRHDRCRENTSEKFEHWELQLAGVAVEEYARSLCNNQANNLSVEASSTVKALHPESLYFEVSRLVHHLHGDVSGLDDHVLKEKLEGVFQKSALRKLKSATLRQFLLVALEDYHIQKNSGLLSTMYESG